MQAPKRLDTVKLISFVKLLSKDNNKVSYVVDEFIENNNKHNCNPNPKDKIFKCLKPNTTKITNDLPPKLRSYYDPFIKDFIRHGSSQTQLSNENVTLYYSVLNACIPKFLSYTEMQQIEYIKSLREKLIAYVSNVDVFKRNNYEKLKWNKKTIVQSLVQFKVTKLTLKILADFFSVNIFILNILEDKLYVVSGNDYFDMFRYNIFVTLNNSTFETLAYLGDKMLHYDNFLVKKIISIHKNILILFNTNLNDDASDPLEFTMKLDDFNIIPIKEKENEFNEITESEGGFTKEIELPHPQPLPLPQDNPVMGVVFNVSLKMKLDALQDMATKLNIDINKSVNGKKKSKTKNELVDEINNILIK